MIDQTTDTSVRRPFIPYGRQSIDEQDVQAVVDVLRSDWLTTGPKVVEFEQGFARTVHADHAVAVSSGTAALEASMHAAGIGPGDEVIVATMTFVASANCVVHRGAKPVFCDVDEDTFLLDVDKAQGLVTPRTKAILAVDYGGHPCDYDALRDLCDRKGLVLVADACHSLGGAYHGRPVGSLADLSVFSFHPVKNMTTGEGGMVTTNDERYAASMRRFRNHGITSDHRDRENRGTYEYDMADLGHNHRLTDLQSALGLNQLRKLPSMVTRRRQIARKYSSLIRGWDSVKPQTVKESVDHAYHLFPVVLEGDAGEHRDEVYRQLRKNGIGVNVHYKPVHLHSYYRKRFGVGPGNHPVSEDIYKRILSLPMHPGLDDDLITQVVDVFEGAVELVA